MVTITGGITLGPGASEADKQKFLDAIALTDDPLLGRNGALNKNRVKPEPRSEEDEGPGEKPADEVPVDLSKLTKLELDDLAKEKYGVDLDRRKSKKSMIEKLREKLGL